jgi:hypothetical protein
MSEQTHSWHSHPPHPGVGFAWQPSQTPQSVVQLSQVSPYCGWQIWLPQHWPQSCAHVLQVSP